MIQSTFRSTILSVVFLIPALAASPQTQKNEMLPPVPGRILNAISKENHPLLMDNYDGFRLARRKIRQDLLEDRGKEFKQRVVGYFNPNSPWYIGEGPLGEREDYHPLQLTDGDFSFYIKVVCEVIAYWSIEHERWASQGLMREFQRMLDEMQPTQTAVMVTPNSEYLDERRVWMLALASMVYDSVYSRFDTKDRHPLNNRLNQIRQKVASDCAAIDPAILSPESRIVRGTALGLSTLLCISIYPHEWEDEARFSIQSFLPDLYRAITYTNAGMREIAETSPRIALPLPKLEALLTLAIPWMQTAKRLGYPYEIQQNAYSKIVESFETHRIPDSAVMVQPFLGETPHDPWIPRSQTIFTAAPVTMYEKKDDGSQPFIPFGQEKETIASASSAGSFKIPNSLQALDVNVKRDGRRTLSLREQLERYGYPKKPKPAALPKEEKISNPNAGWVPPAGLALPSVWGALYLLAERENPQSQAGKLWEEYAYEVDSHPYTFLIYDEFPMQGRQTERDQQFIEYPDVNATLLGNFTPRGQFLLASQAASEMLILPTYAIDCESFLLSESAHEWRWFHEIPSSTRETTEDSSPKKAKIVDSATPLLTSLFSCWESNSPAGKTIVLRRHLGGVGGGYTVFAHIPDSQGKKVEYVNFSVPQNGNVVPNPDVDGMYGLYPSEDELPDRAMSMEMWRMEQTAVRRGEKRPTVGGILNVLFGPECMKPGNAFEGALGRVLEAEVADPKKPFFYLTALDIPGREMFEVKYASFPFDGLRILEWKQGIELIAVKTGKEIKNSFVESDADLIVAVRDSSMKGMFYAMVNGTYLRCKFAPTQRDWFMLADAKDRPVTVAWCQRRLYTTAPPRSESRFYAPKAVGFECPGFAIKYGQKSNQAVVLGHDPERKRRP